MVYFPMQPRDTCYIASEGLSELTYSGYNPHAHSWDDFPLLKDILDVVRMLMFETLFIIIYNPDSLYELPATTCLTYLLFS